VFSCSYQRGQDFADRRIDLHIRSYRKSPVAWPSPVRDPHVSERRRVAGFTNMPPNAVTTTRCLCWAPGSAWQSVKTLTNSRCDWFRERARRSPSRNPIPRDRAVRHFSGSFPVSIWHLWILTRESLKIRVLRRRLRRLVFAWVHHLLFSALRALG